MQRGVPPPPPLPLPTFHYEKNPPTELTSIYHRSPSNAACSQEREIRRLQEASVTSDGMLSCYTPFLLAIIKRRVADAAAAAAEAAREPPPAAAEEGGVLLAADAGAAANGNSDGLYAGAGDRHSGPRSSGPATVEAGGKTSASLVGRGKRWPGDGDDAVPPPPPPPPSSSRCPRELCAEALWALSEYAVLSPGLAAAEVLPLAEGLASDTGEHAQVISSGLVGWMALAFVRAEFCFRFLSCSSR